MDKTQLPRKFIVASFACRSSIFLLPIWNFNHVGGGGLKGSRYPHCPHRMWVDRGIRWINEAVSVKWKGFHRFTFLRTSVCLCTCPFHGVQKLSVLLIEWSSERLVNFFFSIFCVSLKDFICYLVEYFVWR